MLTGQDDHVVLGDILGLDHDADLAPGLNGVGLLDTGVSAGQLLELFQTA